MSHFKKEEKGEKNKAYLFPLNNKRRMEKCVCKNWFILIKRKKPMYHANQFTT